MVVDRALGVGRLSEKVKARDTVCARLGGAGRGQSLRGKRDAVRGSGGDQGIAQIRLGEHLRGLECLILSSKDEVGGRGARGGLDAARFGVECLIKGATGRACAHGVQTADRGGQGGYREVGGLNSS